MTIHDTARIVNCKVARGVKDTPSIGYFDKMIAWLTVFGVLAVAFGKFFFTYFYAFDLEILWVEKGRVLEVARISISLSLLFLTYFANLRSTLGYLQEWNFVFYWI